MIQLMFVVCAITLLGILMVPMHRVSLDRQTVLISTEALSTTTAVGQELMEEILVRKFDNAVTGTSTDATLLLSSLTLPASLGAEGTPSDTPGVTTSYNDVDDFNLFKGSVSSPRIGMVYDTVMVSYVDTLYPYSTVVWRSWFKRIDIKVWNKYLPTQAVSPQSIIISKIVSFRYKN